MGSNPIWIVALYVQTVHLLTNTMQTAFDVIKDTYDYETCKEIVDHGCQSGVCSQHIYHADTIGFFTEHAEEVTGTLVDDLGVDFLKEVFNRHDGDLDLYMNDLTWAFIELVAMQKVDEVFEQEIEDERIVASYYNPPASLTDNRYALA